MAVEEKTKWMILISTIGFVLGIGAIFYERITGVLSPGEFVVGATTFFLGFVTLYLVFTELAEGSTNRKQVSELSARDRAISNYPLLSQKIELKTPRIQTQVRGIDQLSQAHYYLLIKNYGKGPAIDQDQVFYIFFKGENTIHQNLIKITGAHDIIAPDDERRLDMTKLSENDWTIGMETRYDRLFVRLLHNDIQRNKCCNCTTYEHQPELGANFGKMERHWYLSSYPEISSAECIECVWLALDDTTE